MKLTREIIQVLAIIASLMVMYMITDVIKLWMTLEYGDCNDSYSETNSES